MYIGTSVSEKLVAFVNSEDGSKKFLWNAGTYLQNYMAWHFSMLLPCNFFKIWVLDQHIGSSI